MLTEQVTTEEYGIAVPKNKPELTRDLNAALAKLKADGSYQAIVNKWFEAPRNEPAFGFSAVFADFDARCCAPLLSIEVTAPPAPLVGRVGLLVGVGRLKPRSARSNLCSDTCCCSRHALLVQLFIWFFGLPRFAHRAAGLRLRRGGPGHVLRRLCVGNRARRHPVGGSRPDRAAARSLVHVLGSGHAHHHPAAGGGAHDPAGQRVHRADQNSALVSLLTIHDLMHEGQKIISVSYLALETHLLVVALVYLVLTTVAMW